jgi:gamma-glutamyltranspeptidase / glutathione hydrolase
MSRSNESLLRRGRLSETKMINKNQVPDVGEVSVTEGEHGVVTCAHPDAALAGLSMLRQGGNAIDALVAMSWALTVLEPTMSGLLGVNTVLIKAADSPSVRWLDGVGDCPENLTQGLLSRGRNAKHAGIDALPPTLVSSNAKLLAEHGTVSLRESIEPALMFARQGVVLSDVARYWFEISEQQVNGSIPDLYRSALANPGLPFRQTEMADALEEIASDGTTPFTEGRYANALIAALEATGGVMTPNDLRHAIPSWRDCVSVSIGDAEVFAPGWPNCSYETLATIATVMAHRDNPIVGSPEYWHIFIEASKLAAQSRMHHWPRDPSPMAIENLLTPEQIQKRADTILADHQQKFDVSWVVHTDGGHTSHLAAADSQGNVACATQTLGGLFGCNVWAEGLPINGLGAYVYAADKSAPASLQPTPAKPTASILQMLMCMRDGNFSFTMGSPGGFAIPPTVAQATLAVLMGNADLTAVVSAPRLTPANGDVVVTESRMPQEVLASIRRQHQCRDVGPWSWLVGSLHSVSTKTSGVLQAVADPRRGGHAVGM